MPRIVQQTLPLPSACGELDGFTILHLSDLHLKKKTKGNDRFFQELAQQEVDIVAVTGDIIDNDNGIQPATEYLGMLKHRYGLFCCIGNHDEYDLKPYHGFLYKLGFLSLSNLQKNNFKALEEGIQKIGGRFLKDEFFTLETDRGNVQLYGVHPPLTMFFEKNAIRSQSPLIRTLKKELKEKRKEETYTIFLTHTPDFASVIPRGLIDLLLAGHTHGGIIRLPGVGPLLYMSRTQRIISQGLYSFQDYTIHVSPGLSDNKPLPRFGTESEATLLTLKPDKPEQKEKGAV